MNSSSGTQKTLMKSNKCLYPPRTCGCLTSSSMSCKSRWRYYCYLDGFSYTTEAGSLSSVLWNKLFTFLSLTCSVDVGKSPDIPYVYVTHDGLVRNYKPIQVVTACTLNIYNFPFDVQKCSLTFQSWLHIGKTFTSYFRHIYNLTALFVLPILWICLKMFIIHHTEIKTMTRIYIPEFDVGFLNEFSLYNKVFDILTCGCV